MVRFGRPISVVALVTFVLGGGAGVAPTVLCSQRDGTVHVEAAFNRCCAAEGAREPHGSAEAFAHHDSAGPAAGEYKDSECGDCVDVPVVTVGEAPAPHKGLSPGECVHAAMATPLATATFAGGIDSLSPLGTDVWTLRGGTARASDAAIPLRC